jgi:hypothetical protein
MNPSVEIHPPESLEGWSCPLPDQRTRQAILPLAVDYRGDVTIHCEKNGPVVGFVFNVGAGEVTMLRPDQLDPTRIPVDRIVRVDFSGRNPANGRSWEAWLEKVDQAKARGEVAELYPEDLGD